MTEQEKWEKVIDLAEKYGFIIQSFDGIATLATYEIQRSELGIKNDKDEV